MNKVGPHFSDCVVELSGADDHLHLKDVPFGHAPLNQTLQHLLLVQSDIREKKTKNSGSVRTHSNSQLHLFQNTRTTYLKLPVRSEAPGLNNT